MPGYSAPGIPGAGSTSEGRPRRRGRAWSAPCSLPLGALAALVLAGEAAAAELFVGQRFATGETPLSVAVADVDGDTVPDLVTANLGSSDLSVLRGNGDGTFQAARSVALSSRPRFAAVADLNADTIPDLIAVPFFFPKAVSILWGNGDGTFQAEELVAVQFPFSLAVGDFGADGIPDLVTANYLSHDVSVLLGNGDGSFQAPFYVAVGQDPSDVATADLDGDTLLDLVTANPHGNDVSVLLGNGDGSFGAETAFPAGDLPYAVAVADLDGDTVLDLVTANLASDDVSVLRGEGDGRFGAPTAFAAGDGPTSVAVADFDLDGIPDIAAVNELSNDVSVFLGTGDGSFQAQAVFAVGDVPRSIRVADLDGDGAPDLVNANSFSGDVSVLLNTTESILPARIDIKPKGAVNRIRPNRGGVVRVAILGSDSLSVLDVDVATLAFGPEGASPAHRKGPRVRDVDCDGVKDLLARFHMRQTGIAVGDEEACLTGELLDGTPFEGCDAVQTVPRRRRPGGLEADDRDDGERAPQGGHRVEGRRHRCVAGSAAEVD